MSDSFDKDSIVFGFSVGCILGIIIAVLLVNYGTGKERQIECKELDGVQICRDVDYFPWKVKESDK